MSEKLKNIKPFALKKLLYNNKFIIPLSILLAFVLWLVIVTQENPIRERRFSNIAVSVNLENTFAAENGLNVIGDISSQKISVVVKGPNYVVSSLRPEDLNVYVSAASVDEPGVYTLDVMATRSSTNYEVISISPSTIKVEFDEIITQDFPVITAKPKGEIEVVKGLEADSGIVSGFEGNVLQITGPKNKIETIESVEAIFEVDDVLSETKTFDAELNLLDKDGKKISLKNLTLNAENVKVKVPVYKKKTVDVVADFTNLPGGFNKSTIKYKIDHATVTIKGNPDAIDKISNVTLSAIDITQLSSKKKEFEVTAKLPEGVRLADEIETFKVTIDTTGYIERSVTVSTIKAINLKSGLKSTHSKISNVKIYGPKASVNKIVNDLSLISAEVDLLDKGEGNHSVAAVFSFKNYNNVWVVGTYSSSVTISKK